MPALVALLASGCLPFAVPPARVEAGAGLEATETRPIAAVKASVQPLGMFAPAHRRRVDAGMGYGFITRGADSTVHGPFVSGEYFLWQRDIAADRAWRLGVLGSGGLAFSGESERGYQAALGVDFEQTGFVGGFASGNQVAVGGYGEWTFGTFASVGVMRVGGLDLYSFVVGLQGRVPGSIGAICCLTPSF